VTRHGGAAPPFLSVVSTKAASEVTTRRFGFGQISFALEALPHLEQVLGQSVPADVDAEAFDATSTAGDGAAGLPEEAAPLGASLSLSSSDEAERAVRGLDLAHISSLCRRKQPGIVPAADSGAGFY
jgi:hypothetical protein